MRTGLPTFRTGPSGVVHVVRTTGACVARPRVRRGVRRLIVLLAPHGPARAPGLITSMAN